MLDKLERKFGRFAIPNLMTYIIGGYVIGYLMTFGSSITSANFIAFMMLEPERIIHNFEIWRVISWILIPPSRGIFWAIIMCIFYWQLGTQLENMWGTFKFNVYIFGGIIFTVIGAFILYGVMYALYGVPMMNMGGYFSTYYINMSIFLAFSLTIPDMPVMLYFCIPVRMKWLAILYAAFIGFEFITVNWAGRVAIICSLLNFLIFFVSSKGIWRASPREMHRRASYRRATTQRAQGAGQGTPWSNFGSGRNDTVNPIARHKCAICGRTDITNPELEFRFCSKCNGNYEYCNEHLFTHTHVM